MPEGDDPGHKQTGKIATVLKGSAGLLAQPATLGIVNKSGEVREECEGL
jgi:hypothetical protein